MSIQRRLVMTAAAVLACAVAGGGIAIAQGGRSGHRSRHPSAHMRHHQRFAHRGRSRSAAHATARGERARRGERVRRAERRCGGSGRLVHGDCRSRAVRRAIHRCDLDDVSRDTRGDLSREVRERCGLAESSEEAAQVVPTTTEAANFAG